MKHADFSKAKSLLELIEKQRSYVANLEKYDSDKSSDNHYCLRLAAANGKPTMEITEMDLDIRSMITELLASETKKLKALEREFASL